MRCLAQKACPAKAKNGVNRLTNPMGHLETGVDDKGRGRCSKGHSALFSLLIPYQKCLVRKGPIAWRVAWAKRSEEIGGHLPRRKTFFY